MTRITSNMYVTCVLLTVFLSGVHGSTRPDVQKLLDHLLQSYNKELGPNINQSQPITIQVSFLLFTLQEYDDKSGRLAFLGMVSIRWTDDRLVWNPLQYGNTTIMSLPQSKVWFPSFFIGKPYSSIKWIGDESTYIRYTADGMAYWDVPDLFEVSCTANVAYYPMDRQLCEIYLIPGGIGFGATFDFEIPFDTMIQEQFIENGIWKLLSTQILEQKQPEGNLIMMVIKFERRPLFVILNLLLPILVIGILNVFIFLLPPEPGERSAFGVTVLLAMAVFLSIVSDKLPSTSEPHIARVSVFLLVQLIISAMAMVFVMFGLVLYNKKDNKPVPIWVKRLVLMCSKRTKQRQEIRDENVKYLTESNISKLRRKQCQGEDQNVYCNMGPNDNIRGRPRNGYIYRDHPNSYGGQSNCSREHSYDHIINHSDGNRNVRLSPIARHHHHYRDHGCVECKNNQVKNAEEVTDENIPPDLVWADVASWFDKVCLVLFFVLNSSTAIASIVDWTRYLAQEF